MLPLHRSRRPARSDPSSSWALPVLRRPPYARPLTRIATMPPAAVVALDVNNLLTQRNRGTKSPASASRAGAAYHLVGSRHPGLPASSTPRWRAPTAVSSTRRSGTGRCPPASDVMGDYQRTSRGPGRTRADKVRLARDIVATDARDGERPQAATAPTCRRPSQGSWLVVNTRW